MHEKIPQNFLDNLIARTDLIPLIQARMQLKKTGKNYSGLCPFHDEKSPSFSVNAEKQFYYCFGCGAHGNAIGFLMAFDRLEFIPAVETLANQLGLEIPTTKSNTPNLKEDYALLHEVALFYEKSLRQSQKAIDYLKSRGLTGQVAKSFALGYAAEGWNHLDVIANSNPEKKNRLHQHGLIIKKENGNHYDRFRDRIIFPIKDPRGRVIAFGGRSIGVATPKYLNSPESATFHKSQELYGLHETLKAAAKPLCIVIVEGYLDVIALHQHGLPFAVATLGTATNLQHLHTLFRYTNDVVFCFDGDTAGRKAAWKALTDSLPLLRDGIQLRFMFLNQNDDPDTLVRRVGNTGFLQRLTQAEPISTVFFDHLKSEIPLQSPENKALFAKTATDLLRQIPKGIFHNLMLEKLAKTLDIFTSSLAATPQRPPPKQSSPTKLLSNEHKAIALLLQAPQLLTQNNTLDVLEPHFCQDYPLLTRVITTLQAEPGLSIGALMQHFEVAHEQATISQLAARTAPFSANGMTTEFFDAIKRLRYQCLQRNAQRLIEKSRQAPLTAADKETLQAFLTSKDNSDK